MHIQDFESNFRSAACTAQLGDGGVSINRTLTIGPKGDVGTGIYRAVHIVNERIELEEEVG